MPPRMPQQMPRQMQEGLPDFRALFDRPVIILAAPRSGSTLLFETLSECADAWTIGGESHAVIESLPALNPGSGMISSNRLTAQHAAGGVADMMRRRFARMLRDRDGREFFRNQQLGPLRFLEKTPKNSLRLPFLDAIFPDALYIFLFRDVRANLSSMMEAWRSTRWKTYPRLAGWNGPPWSLLLPPDGDPVEPQVRQQVISPQTARAVRRMLAMVTQPGGTALKAQVPGYSVAGKTGTSRKWLKHEKRYATDRHRGWFVGMAPADKPRIVVAVMIDEPRAGKYFGGDVAAPVFSQVVQQTLRSMGVQPDLDVKTQIVARDDEPVRENY